MSAWGAWVRGEDVRQEPRERRWEKQKLVLKRWPQPILPPPSTPPLSRGSGCSPAWGLGHGDIVVQAQRGDFPHAQMMGRSPRR